MPIFAWYSRRRRSLRPDREVLGAQAHGFHPWLEVLEARALPSGGPSDFSTLAANAHALTLAADDSGTQTGTIQAPGGVDVYQFTAAHSGGLAIQQQEINASGLNTSLTVLDNTGQTLVASDDTLHVGLSAVALNVVTGQVYYVEAAGHLTATGAYTLTFTPYQDDFGNTPASAQLLTPSATGVVTQQGTIEVPGDVDVFQFTTPVSGGLSISAAETGGSGLNPSLTVFDSTGKQLAANTDASNTGLAAVSLNVAAGATYYLQEGGRFSSTGSYQLSVTPFTDDFPNTEAAAFPLTVSASGTATQAGAIEVPGDVDMFQFTAAASGSVLIQENQAAGSTLSPVLTVFDSLGQAHAGNSQGISSTVALDVSAGATYYVQAAGASNGSGRAGAYGISLAPYTDDFGNDPASAFPLTLAADGSATQNGTLEVAGDVDVFSFTPATAAPVVISLTPASGSAVGVALTVTDSAGNSYPAHVTPAYLTNSSQVLLHTVAGRTYYLTAGSTNLSTGAYMVQIAPYQDDYGNDPASAFPLTLAADGSATQSGNIEVPGDVDVFQFTAATSEPVIINLAATTDSFLYDPVLGVTDSAGNAFASGTSSSFQQATVALDTVAGQTYFLTVDSSGYASTGAYELSITPYQDDHGNDPASASPLTLAADGSAMQSGTIEVPGDVDVFDFTAATSASVVITVTASADSYPLTSLGVADSAGNSYASDGNSVNGQVVLHTVAGQTYYLTAGLQDGNTGAYELSIAPYQDDFGNDQAQAAALTLAADGSATQSGALEVPGDSDFFQFTAATSGLTAISLTGGFGVSLTVTDSAGTTYPASSNEASLYTVAGQTYYLDVTSFFPFTAGGNYELRIAQDDYGNDPAHAFALTPAPDGSATQAGTIEVPGDVDVFKFTATSSQSVVMSVTPAAGSNLSPSLTVVNSAGNYYYPSAIGSSQVVLETNSGQTYYLTVAGGSGTGGYEVSVAPYQDDYGNDPAHAFPLTLGTDGTVTQPGTIEVPGDVDVFRFTASTTTSFSVNLTPASGSTLAGSLNVTDAFGFNVNSSAAPAPNQAYVFAAAGQTYYIQVSGGSSTGAYLLSLAGYSDDYGNTRASATDLTLSTSGTTVQTGTIEVPADVDVFQVFNPSFSGSLTVQEQANDSGLIPVLTVLDASGQPLATQSGSQQFNLAQVVVHVDAGFTYYIQAAGDGTSTGTSTGGYQLSTFASLPFLTPIVTSASAAAADFNNDGNLDLVTFNVNASTVSVALGKGDGTFHNAVSYPAGTEPTSVAVADLNGDGRLDLVTTNSDFGGSNDVTVLLGNGDGTFGPALHLSAGDAPDALVVADVNGDGRPDLLVANELSGTVSVLLGNGDGTFQSAQNVDVGGEPFGVTAADINGDGQLDLFVANGTSVSVLLGNGDGTFQTPQTISAGPFPNSVALADVNGDGRSDLIVTNGMSNAVSVLLGNGHGSFQAPQNFDADLFPSYVAVADVNGDSRPDLLALNADGRVSVLLGNGDGSFQPQVAYGVGNSVDIGPLDFAVGDFNNDGVPDLASLNSSAATVLAGHGDGSFQSNFGFHDTLATAIPLTFDTNNQAQGTGNLAGPNQVDVYSISLSAGDQFVVDASAFNTGSPAIALRIFNSFGQQLDQQANTGGADTFLTFRATVGGTYFVGISSNDNINYDSTLSGSASGGLSTGSYTLTLTRSSAHDTLGTAITFPFLSNNQGQVSGTLVDPNQVNLYAVFLNGGDAVTVDVRSQSVGNPASYVRVFDSINNEVAAQANTGSQDTILTFDASSNQNYYVGISSGGNTGYDPNFSAGGSGGFSTGGYTLTLTVTPNAFDDTLASALPLTFNANQQAQVADTLALPNQVHLYAVQLNANNQVAIDVHSQAPHDPTTHVRIFDSAGHQFPAQADQSDLDTTLTFDVNLSGSYYVGISSNGNDSYDPNTTGSGHGGSSTGAYTLTLSLSSFVPMHPNYQELPVGNVPESVAVGDFNHDGKPDLVTANFGDGTVSVLLGRGDGTFAPAVAYAVTPASISYAPPISVAVGDFNNDGNPDLVVASYGAYDPATNTIGPGSISVLLGNGDGTFRLPTATFTSGGSSVIAGVAVGDFNNDHKLDVAVSSAGAFDTTTGTSGPGTISVLLGNGDGTLQSAVTYRVGTYPGPVLVADFNGNADVVNTNYLDNTVTVLLGNGNGTFQAAAVYAVGNATGSLAVGDFNNDGKPDLITGNQGDNTVSVLLGNGNGTFRTGALYALGNYSNSLAVGDFNNDGNLDLASVNYYAPPLVGEPTGTGTVSVAFGRGDGTFLPAATYAVGNGPVLVAVGDFNRDGSSDLATADINSNVVSVMLNLGDGQFQGRPQAIVVPTTVQPTLTVVLSVSPQVTVYVTVAATSQYVRTPGTDQFVTSLSISNPLLPTLGGRLVTGSVNTVPELALLLDQSGPISGFLDQRSALQVLTQGSNQDVYLTYRGTQLPIGVVDVSASAAVAQGTNLPGGDLVVVATLQSGRLTESLSAHRSEAAPDQRAFALFLPPTPVRDRSAADIAAGGIMPAGWFPPEAAGWEGYALGASEGLRQRLLRQRASERLYEMFDAFQEGIIRFQRWLMPPASPATSRSDAPNAPSAALIAAIFALGMVPCEGEEERQT